MMLFFWHIYIVPIMTMVAVMIIARWIGGKRNLAEDEIKQNVGFFGGMALVHMYWLGYEALKLPRSP